MLGFFAIQREVFGVCPQCNEFFRLSDCRIYQKKRPVLDWLEKLDLDQKNIDKEYEELEEMKEEIQERGRQEGRKIAEHKVKKIDCVFAPHDLNPDDAKVIFHPIDFIVFSGMKGIGQVHDITLFDRVTQIARQRSIQESIERAVDRESCEWRTLRVDEEGRVNEERR